MSLESYNKAKILISEHSILLNPKKAGISEHLLCKAENMLELKLIGDYRRFLLEYGTLGFGASEIYGIIDEDFINSTVPDAIWYTLTERREINMPDYLIIIYSVGNGELFALNYNMLNENREPKVTSYWPGFALEAQSFEVIANDFGDFLLDIVQHEIK
jgi:hypothetical protein